MSLFSPPTNFTQKYHVINSLRYDVKKGLTNSQTQFPIYNDTSMDFFSNMILEKRDK